MSGSEITQRDHGDGTAAALPLAGVHPSSRIDPPVVVDVDAFGRELDARAEATRAALLHRERELGLRLAAAEMRREVMQRDRVSGDRVSGDRVSGDRVSGD